MIKLKDILFENNDEWAPYTVPDIFIPRRVGDRVERYIKQYIRNGSKGNLKLSFMALKRLPAILKDVEVEGDFLCSGNYIETLENFPKKIGGGIDISWNSLKSLEGLNIESVNGTSYGYGFDCKGNHLPNLIGGPKIVYGGYYCSENDMTSLKGAPTTVDGNFYCSHNKLTTLEGGPITVTKDYSANFNKLETLKGLPKHIGGNLSLIALNKIFTQAQIRAISDIKGRIELV